MLPTETIADVKPDLLPSLERIPIFGGIRAEVLEFLLQRAATLRIAAGDYVFHEGDQAESLFVLNRGRIAILKQWKGRDYLLAVMRPGDCFGEMALMDLCPRSASARAEAQCTALELRSSSLLEVYENDIEQFALIQMNLGREVSRRLRLADERLFHFRVGAPCTDLKAEPTHWT